MEEDWKTLYENQVKINESWESHVQDLNRQIFDQSVIPDCKSSFCDKCTFKISYFSNALKQCEEASRT